MRNTHCLCPLYENSGHYCSEWPTWFFYFGCGLSDSRFGLASFRSSDARLLGRCLLDFRYDHIFCWLRANYVWCYSNSRRRMELACSILVGFESINQSDTIHSGYWTNDGYCRRNVLLVSLETAFPLRVHRSLCWHWCRHAPCNIGEMVWCPEQYRFLFGAPYRRYIFSCPRFGQYASGAS